MLTVSVQNGVAGVVCALAVCCSSLDTFGQVRNESAKLVPSDGVAFDEFGVSVSISGEVAVVGAHQGPSVPQKPGAAYIFRWNGSTWVEEQRLVASDGAAKDEFGEYVSLSRDVAVVGSWLDDDKGTDSGSAYVFRWNGSSWVEEQKLVASDGTAYDQFGTVSVSGNVIVAGAFLHSDYGSGSGSAYVYRWNGSTWVEEQKLLASDGEIHDAFGISVSVFDDTAFVGAHGDGDNGTEFGAVYVFHWNGSAWIEEQKLQASDGEEDDYFGRSVSLSGDTALVGAGLDDCVAGVNCGSAYLFRWDGAMWVEEQKLLASDAAADDCFGNFVSLSGDVGVVGAIADDCSAGPECGAAYVYRFNGSSWVEEAKLTASERAAFHGFGPVGVSGDVVLVGAYRDNDNGSNSGSAYVFSIPPSIPTLSQWGLVAMTLLVLASGMLVLKGRRQTRRSVA